MNIRIDLNSAFLSYHILKKTFSVELAGVVDGNISSVGGSGNLSFFVGSLPLCSASNFQFNLMLV